jgi:hypothetical protein
LAASSAVFCPRKKGASSSTSATSRCTGERLSLLRDKFIELGLIACFQSYPGSVLAKFTGNRQAEPSLRAKTANALFAVELDRIGFAYGVHAFSLHPGRIVTDLARFLSEEESAIGGVYKTTVHGAPTSVWCAASPPLEGKGGVYCLDVDIAEVIPVLRLKTCKQVYG